MLAADAPMVISLDTTDAPTTKVNTTERVEVYGIVIVSPPAGFVIILKAPVEITPL